MYILTYAGVVAGLPLVGAAAYANYQAGRMLLLGLWVASYLPLVIPLIWPRIPYSLHAVVFVAFLSGVGVLGFLQPGYEAVATAVLLCLPAFAAVLWGRSTGRWVLVGGLVGAGAGSWLASGQAFALGGTGEGMMPFPVWWGSPVAVLLLGGGLTLAVGQLRGRTDSLLDEERRLTSALRDLRKEVKEQGDELTRCASQSRCLETLGSVARSAVRPDKVVEHVLETVSQSVPCYAVRVFLRDSDGECGQGAPRWRVRLHHSLSSAASADYGEERTDARIDGIAAWAAERREAIVLADVQTDGGRQLYWPMSRRTGAMHMSPFSRRRAARQRFP